MTLAPAFARTFPAALSGSPVGAGGAAVPAAPVVTAVLVLHDGARWLPECLDGIAAQTRPPERLVVVDTGSLDEGPALVAAHAGVRRAVDEVRVLRLAREVSFGTAVARAQREAFTSASDGERAAAARPDHQQAAARPMWLWLLHDDSAPDPQALQRLVDTVRRSPSVGIAGPKLTAWDDPRRLLEVGQQLTRSGRRLAAPARGEFDQGQHDHRSDVLAVNTAGMLVRSEVFAELGGFDPALPQFGDDLDLCWRAHLAGYRVVVVPSATVRDAAASALGLRAAEPNAAPDACAAVRRDRSHSRRIALSRCAVPVVPLMALWITLSSIGCAAALLVLKRPRRALLELGDAAVVLTPWRVVAARWRSRGSRRVRRRDLGALFVPMGAALRSTLDSISDAVTFESRPATVPTGGEHGGAGASASTRAVESGPVADEAQNLSVPAPLASRVLRHPGFLAVLAATVVAGAAWRVLLHAGALVVTARGVSGGELLPVVGDASGLWHSYLDSWHGPGLGGSAPAAPYVAIMAAWTWVVSSMPFVAGATSPVAVATGWLMLAAMPLSAWSAYLASRVATRSRWARGWAALAWATLPTLTTGLAAGRLGAVVAHLLLPLAAAGLACAARKSGTTPATFGAALAVTALAAFAPPLGVLALLSAVLLLVLGRGRRRLHALLLLLVPLALLGPWLLDVVHDPRLLLAGPGLSVWQPLHIPPWQVALLHPGGPGSYPVLLSAPLVAIGVVGLLRRGAASPALTALGLLAVSGLAAALAAPHVVVGHVPDGMPGSGTAPPAGTAITPWPGLGLEVLALALLGAALVGADGLRQRLGSRRLGLRRLVAAALAAAGVVGVLGAAGFAAWDGVGGLVGASEGLMPAVALADARSPLGSRLLVLEPGGPGGPGGSSGGARRIGYLLRGPEPGDLARTLPASAGVPTTDRSYDALVAATVAGPADGSPVADSSSRRSVPSRLATAGVGYVGYRGSAEDAVPRRLDTTEGLVRLGSSDRLVLWRVLPSAGAVKGSTVPPARARLVDPHGVPIAAVDVLPGHSRIDTALPAGGAGRRLMVAEPLAWSRFATVSVDRRRLPALAGTASPTYVLPSTPGRLRVELPPRYPWWRWAQVGLLGMAVFLAVPFGNRRSRGAA